MASVVSLFSGCGGLDLGFKEAGFEFLYACDSDPSAVDSYRRNIGDHAIVRDVTSVLFHEDIRTIGSADVVLGGFPCQGFSKAGPKSAGDNRNVLYLEMLRAVDVLRPQVFIAENVDGLIQNFQGAYLKAISEDFEKIGYTIEHRILDAVAFGLPQHRRRVIFVGMARSAGKQFAWPSPTHKANARNGESSVYGHTSKPVAQLSLESPSPKSLVPARTIRDAISDLIELDDRVADHRVTGAWPEGYEFIFEKIKAGQKLCNVRHAKTSVYTWQIPEYFGEVSESERRILETIGHYRRHKQYGNIPNGNPLPVGEIERLSGESRVESSLQRLETAGYLKEMDGKYDLKGAMFCSGLFKRPDWNRPAPTVLTNFHNPRYFLHPLENRPFSLRECARLQSFPDNFVFCGDSSRARLIEGYRHVGNAVPPLISRLLAKAVGAVVTGDQAEVMQL